ncbi:MORC family CW-type zinc finger protein 4 [Spatholobus suberectus]|nr:MORC family CW-type zinc finger protein 4 [Spatholobus suberectus]
MQAYNTEFEEGEAFFCYKDDYDDNIDLDSLSYIDERIQHVLGHFQKDFEGGISAERLGAKYGDYGSFLPTCERSPPLRSCPKTPQKHNSSPKSPSNLNMAAAFHNSKAPSNMPPSMRLGTASHNAHPFRNLRVPSVDDSVKNTGISSNKVIEKCTWKNDCANKSENLTDQRTLKFRIKVKSDILAKKNAEIYSGLGLDDSPSSSMENSQEESEDMPHASQETPEESPTGIVQVMTSFTIPGGVLISPLHDSLLYLIRKENALGDSRPMSSLNGHQEHYSMSTDESDSFVGDGHLLKKRKVTVVDQSEKLHMNGNCSENDMTLHMKKRLGNRTPDCKDFLSNDLRSTPLSSSICDAGETAEVTGKAFEVSKEVDKDGVECRMVSTEAVKEDSLESISGQDFDKIEKQNMGSSFMKKVLEHKMEISQNNNSTDPKNNSKCNAFEISKRIKCGAVKCKVDQDTQKCETNQKGKVKSESKNESKGERSPGKVVTNAEKDIIVTSNNAMVNDRKSTGIGVTSSKSKMHKIKSLKDDKVRDCDRDSLKGKKTERKADGIDPIDGPPLNKATVNANLDHVEKSTYRVKVKERSSGNKVVNQLSAGPCVKDATGAFPIAENKPISEMVPPSAAAAAAAPQLIEEDWVCCDSCQKWRLLPMGLKPEQLPEKWLCSMLYWLPGMNRCNISEEETTKALYALYQMPISEGQSNMQSHATGPETGLRSVDALQLGLNHKKSISDVMLDRGKKKHGINEKAKLGINNDMHQLSNTEKNNAQESVKNRSLNDVNQWPADSNRMKKSNSKHSSRLNNLIEEKNTPKAKEKLTNGGDRNHVRLKLKMEDNQHGSGTPKKSKTEDICYADKQLNPGMEFRKVGLNSRNGLPTKASGKNMRKYDDYCLSDNLEDKLAFPVKKGDRAEFLSDDGSLDATNSSKSGSIKKRKMSDWLDNDKHNKTLSLEGDMQCGKEGNVNRKEKKYVVLNTEAKSVTDSDDKLIRESGMKRVFLSDSRDEMAVGTEVKSVNKVQQPRKHKKSVASYQALNCFDPLGKDLGSGQLSLAATSSSSKVSGSHKARTNLEDVRGSPVESVTSSPLRTSNMDKRILAAGDTSEKDDARKGGLKGLDNREGKLSVKMERISYDIHPAHGNYGSGSHHEEKMNKSNQENALSWQKSGKVTSLRVKEKDRNSGSEVSRHKEKVSASDNDFSKICVSYELAVDPNHHASGTETRNDVKNSSLKSKHKTDNLSKKNSSRHWSNETGKQTELKQKDIGNPVLKVNAPCNTNRKNMSQQNLIQNFEEENKANPVCTGSRYGKATVISSSEGKVKRETLYVASRTAPELQKGDMSNGHPVHASGNGDIPKFVRNPVDVSCKVGVNCSSGSSVPDGQLSESSPVTTNSSQTASSILEEATKLKDSADHYKDSGFEFESNETYFKAALKFLHGASLLENSHSESSKHGEMSQMQIYTTTAKLFQSCAHKYERRQEMAAAALAYKCMEVVYMRLVYCKHSSINRDWHELQSTLQMVSQGESPSSSASDIDNLNNLAVVDKATLTRGSNTHVANNQVISACNRPNIVRLLEFTQDISFAMEASRKCHSTFMAANLNMEEAQNKDCITSIRKVVDFSFQDVDELVHLVLTATKAITRAGLGGVRD